MKEQKFPLGFWNYTETGIYGKEAVQDWTDCGMTMAMSPHFDFKKHNVQDLLKILDACEQKGIRVWIDCEQLRWDGAAEDEEEYRKKFIKVYKQFGKHPAVGGFYVGDEPGTEQQLLDAAAAYRIQVEVAPALMPFLNLLPYRQGVQNEIEIIQKDISLHQDFNANTVLYAKQAGMKVIGYDCYYQLDKQDEKETGIHLYFENLKRYTQIAKEANIPLWVTNLSVGHFRYRCPTEDDFRWQLNTSVASGAKGVLWFFFYMRTLRINYRLAPIDEHWERTDRFTWLSRVQRSFLYTYGTLMCRLEHEKTYHYKTAYGTYPLFSPNDGELVTNMACEDDLPGILSYFYDEHRTPYIVLVNNSQTMNRNFTLTYHSRVKKIYRIAWGGEEEDAALNNVCNNYTVTENGIQNSACLAPGQMEVYRIEAEEAREDGFEKM